MATSGDGRPEQRLGTTLPDRGLIAQSTPQGRAYLFLRRWGANGLGHAGWGYRINNSSTYDCGSMENNSGNPTRYFHENNDAWYLTAVSNDRMHQLMRRGVGAAERTTVHYGGDPFLEEGNYLVRPDPVQTTPIPIVKNIPAYRTPGGRRSPGRVIPARTVTEHVEFRRYTEFAWIDVTTADVAGARTLAQQSPLLGYNVAGNNCANLAYDIVRAYGVPGGNLGLLQLRSFPSTWFDRCVELGWTRQTWPDQRG